jgi:catechol 2,3-dioxygenase-like lactoylglutathione lyase family enzyme
MGVGPAARRCEDVLMEADVRIRSARLMASAASIESLHRFYGGSLGFALRSHDAGMRLDVGRGSLEFVAAAGPDRPFYHFALLVPGNRYEAARAWVERSAALLSRPGQAMTTFRFDSWDADACYFHDPAGNIVELIAHRGVAEAAAPAGGFHAAEVAGISELGMVVADPAAAAATLATAGLRLWSGSVEGGDALAFIGGQAHTLILCAPGRPWLPTQRPAECHPAAATLRLATGITVTVGVAGGRLATAARAPGS